MNGYEFKREIEQIFKVARNMYPNVTDEMLDANGAIHYMNGNDSTPFDWNCNNRLCEFFIFHKNGVGFIKANVNSNNKGENWYWTDDMFEAKDELTAEAAIKIQAEMCRSISNCKDCPICKEKNGYSCDFF